MLISREKNILFIHIQKTGGVSIAQILRNSVPDASSYLGTHDHALWAKRQLPKTAWDGLFKFGFVRNPWERLVSWYTMIQEQTARQAHQELRLWQYVIKTASTFEEFIERCTNTIEDVDGAKSFAYNQLDYLTDEDGRVLVDFIGRFEHFERDVREVLHRLGLSASEIPHANRTRHDHYSQHYTERTKNIVAQRYARDIDYFGYTFADRNPPRPPGIRKTIMHRPDSFSAGLGRESNPPVNRERRAILVLGMHRSGTSALTAVLGMLGADLPQDLMPGLPGNNDLGFFESIDLTHAHEELLAASASSWDDPASFTLHRCSRSSAAEFKAKAIAILEREFSQSRLFVLKDPRMCRLVPMWLEILPEIGATPLAVLPIRNPLEVAASLQKRDGMLPAAAYLLWLRHVLEAEHHTRDIPRSLVAYSDLLANWRSTVEKIASDLHLTWPNVTLERQAEIERFLSPRWRHHRVDDDSLYDQADVPEWVKRAHRAIMGLVRGVDDAANRAELDELWDLLAGADQLFGMVLADQSRRFASSRQTPKDSQAMESAITVKGEETVSFNWALATSPRELAESQQDNHSLREQLARVQQDNESLREQLAETGKSLAVAEQKVLVHAQEMALKNLELDAAAHRIQALEASLSWRVTAPLRWLAKTARCFLHSLR
jgi:hypothetical protein